MEASQTTLVHHEASVRGRLMTAAIGVFARKGYAATTVREIVEAAGVTKPALYYHFGSKEGIYLAMMREAVSEFEATAARALEWEGPAEERIVRYLDAMFALILDHLDVMRVLDAIYYGPPQGAPPFDFEGIHRRFIGIVERLVREGIESGEFRPGDPDDLTWAIVGPFDVVRGMSLSNPKMDFGRDRLARLLRVVFEGVRTAGKKESVQ